MHVVLLRYAASSSSSTLTSATITAGRAGIRCATLTPSMVTHRSKPLSAFSFQRTATFFLPFPIFPSTRMPISRTHIVALATIQYEHISVNGKHARKLNINISFRKDLLHFVAIYSFFFYVVSRHSSYCNFSIHACICHHCIPSISTESGKVMLRL